MRDKSFAPVLGIAAVFVVLGLLAELGLLPRFSAWLTQAIVSLLTN